MNLRLCLLTLFSLIAFSGNSLLCRIALRQTTIDPVTFTTIRLISGALILWMVLLASRQKKDIEGSWGGGVALFTYAITFAFAYAKIPAGTGALLLFASIQISMITYGLLIGERLSFWQTIGFCFAILGLTVLMLPSVSAPPLLNAMLMIASGIAWGAYSVLGRRAKNPVSATAGNFLRASPIALVFFLLAYGTSYINLDPKGVAYAVASGTITSGLGYIFWYAALKELKVTYAATVQLSVPVLTAFAGALVLGEAVTKTLVSASFLIVFGVALVVLAKRST